MTIRVGMRIPPCEPPAKIAVIARRAEELGFDQLWFPDSQLLWRDCYIVIAACANATSRIGLGTAITNIVTRHPSVVASAARTLAEMAPGRFRLGLGVGNSSVEPVGLAPSSQADFRAAVRDIRALSNGEEAVFNGVAGRMRDPGPDFEIHVAATGPKNLVMAGEIADGVILLSGVAPDNLARSIDLAQSGVRAKGGDPSLMSVTVGVFAEITDDIGRDAQKLKPICAGIAQRGGREFLRMAGIDIHVPSHVEGVYPDLVHAEDWQLAVERCSGWVSDADAVRFAESFLQHVGSYDLPNDLLEEFGTHVLPGLRGG